MKELGEKCGIFGIYGQGLDVSRLTFFALFALQHRGQESSGIASADGEQIRCYKNTGLITHVYSEENIKSLTGHIALGHNRYSTSKGTGLKHAQPVVDDDGLLALGHNGNLPSVEALLKFLEEKKIETADCSDSELMARAIGYYLGRGQSLREAITNAYPLFTGVFSLLVMTRSELAAVRDQCGIRPFAMGTLNNGVVFASETCAFHPIGAEFLREVNPGELVVVNEKGMVSAQLAAPNQKLDIFEFVYFARPDSTLLGKSVYSVRRNFGIHLAKEHPIKADIVIPVPETGIPVAVGYAESLKIPLEMGLVKNRYIHRTFIQPDQHSRSLGVKLKLTPLPEVVRGKSIVIIDDSIVRGTTSRQIVKALFDEGAREVHFLISSPPVKYPDFYGIDTPQQRDLIGAQKSVKDIEKYLGATSLYYLSLEGLIAATGLPQSVFNTSCFTGEYPVDIKERRLEIVAC